MKNVLVSLVCLALVALFATQAMAEYNKEAVVKAMQANRALMGEISKAAGGKDFFTAAEKLMEVAKDFKSLDAVTPTKGKKEDWDRIHKGIIQSAFKGIGACGEENAEKLNAALTEIGGFMKEGHGMFK